MHTSSETDARDPEAADYRAHGDVRRALARVDAAGHAAARQVQVRLDSLRLHHHRLEEKHDKILYAALALPLRHRLLRLLHDHAGGGAGGGAGSGAGSSAGSDAGSTRLHCRPWNTPS
jgi:hypothetical protein